MGKINLSDLVEITLKKGVIRVKKSNQLTPEKNRKVKARLLEHMTIKDRIEVPVPYNKSDLNKSIYKNIISQEVECDKFKCMPYNLAFMIIDKEADTGSRILTKATQSTNYGYKAVVGLYEISSK